MTARRHARVLAWVTCALVGATATAHARPPSNRDLVGDDLVLATDPVVVVAPDPAPPPQPVVVAVDPVVVQPVVVEPVMVPYDIDPPYDPYVPPPSTREVPSESVIVMASATQAWMTERDGMNRLGRGGVLSFAFLQRHGDFPSGAELSGIAVVGDDASVYDLSLRVIGSPQIRDRKLLPFVAVGLAVGASRLVTDRAKQLGEDVSYGFSIGPSAAVGLHGFLGKNTYWRASAGYLGAGIGAYTADLGIGIVVD